MARPGRVIVAVAVRLHPGVSNPDGQPIRERLRAGASKYSRDAAMVRRGRRTRPLGSDTKSAYGYGASASAQPTCGVNHEDASGMRQEKS